MKRKKKTTNSSLSPFSESSLLVLVALVTLLLQLISFATTWSGSKIYLEDIFPYASLLFALANQATAYFLSNSLRTRISILKCVALLAALCCSTYYSYIGIYNSVNAPSVYLQKRYAQIAASLSESFNTRLAKEVSAAGEATMDAASLITAKYTALLEEKEHIAACKEALLTTETSYAEGMRAPKQSAYENYEDYVAAYNAYIAGMTQGNLTEKEASQNAVLSSYGFFSTEALTEAEAANAAALNALHAALFTSAVETDADSADSGTDRELSGNQDVSDVFAAITSIQSDLQTAIEETARGIPLDSEDTALLHRFFQAAKLCGGTKENTADILTALDRVAEASFVPLLADYQALVSSLPDGRLTASSTMELKSSMDAEILSAILTLNSLLPETDRLSVTDPVFQITDLYLIPVEALRNTESRMTALFCLAVAALIDMLSVLFAISLRRKPLWGRHTLLGSSFADFAPQIYASLPAGEGACVSLCAFLACFRPSPETEVNGYMMKADMTDLKDYYPLSALLCQLNLAKIVPAGFSGNDEETLFLKARFVFWANEIIYESAEERTEVYA